MEGEFILIPQFDNVIVDNCFINDGICGVIIEKSNLQGWLDPKPKIIIEPKYSKLTPFRNGFSLVITTNNKIGYISYDGHEWFK